MHRASSAMGTACNLCHTSSDGRNPFLGSSDGVSGIPGLGCTGCHNGNGLRAHHAANGVTVCSGCHSAGTAPPENQSPPYYGTTGTKANNPCNPLAQANINENWSTNGFQGLDNDGDNFYDTNDSNCQSIPALSITTSSLPAGTVGAAYSQTLAATGGTTPYSWSVTVGSLPAGLSLNASTGVISGTPTAAGASSFTVQVSGGGTATRGLGITINPAPVALSITTSSLPAGTVGAAYSQTLAATGGTTPYSWSVTVGSLPAGLSLNASTGVISGTPTAAGASSFTVQVSGGGTATRGLSITINPDTPPPTGEISGMPGDGAMDVPVTTAVMIALNGTDLTRSVSDPSDIATIVNKDTFTLMVSSPVVSTSSDAPDRDDDHSSCVSDGIVNGSITYNDSHTTATFTPLCKLAYSTTYTATITSVPMSWSFTTIAQTPDTDDDGVEDGEDDHPRDKKKATPPSSRGGGKFLIDITGEASASLANVEGISDVSTVLNQNGKPVGFEFQDGLVSYSLTGVTPGATVTVKITVPGGIPQGSKVFKADTTGFHEVPGAQIQGATVTLTLTDGGNGDSDGQANGVIVDPVGVAVPTASGGGSIDLSTGASGGGCSVVGAGGGWTEAAGSYGLIALAWIGLALRRRKPKSGK